MIARRKLPDEYLEWNAKWKAPFGRQLPFKILPSFLHGSSFARRMAGPFSYQPNNDTRTVEYPWAYFQSGIKVGQTAVDLGGGFSGFPFVLSKCGVDVTVVDPFLDYGPDRHYGNSPEETFKSLNRIYGTNVKSKVSGLTGANLDADSVDVLFSISVLEHLPLSVFEETIREAFRVIKPGGLFVITLDLFLDLAPFTSRQTNDYGCNQSVARLVELSEMQLALGNKEELLGFTEFDVDQIQSQLSNFFIGKGYPAMTEMLVLKKKHFSS